MDFLLFSSLLQIDISYPGVYLLSSTHIINFLPICLIYKKFFLHLILDAGLTHCFCTPGHSFFGDRMLWPKSPLLTDSFATSLTMDNICRFVLCFAAFGCCLIFLFLERRPHHTLTRARLYQYRYLSLTSGQYLASEVNPSRRA